MDSHMKILVTGASGNTGSLLVPKLVNSNADVRVFVRDAAKAESFRKSGAEAVTGDLDDLESIIHAVKDVDKIYLLTWNGPTQLQQVKNVLEAIRKTGGNPHIIRHSMWGPESSRIIKQGLEAEELIKSSNLKWTMLKPTFYMQNLMMAAGTISSDGVIYWDMHNGKLGMIDVRDIAEAAHNVITTEGHEGKSYILTGPRAISFNEIAEVFSEKLGKEVKYINVPGEASKQAMVGMGIPEWIADGYVELSQGFSRNFAASATKNVEILTGREPRSFEQFVDDFMQVFVPGSEAVYK
jgi:uncharacterized protein YbjT (DUF2867 family)